MLYYIVKALLNILDKYYIAGIDIKIRRFK